MKIESAWIELKTNKVHLLIRTETIIVASRDPLSILLTFEGGTRCTLEGSEAEMDVVMVALARHMRRDSPDKDEP